jgi:hypothetical protein
VIIGLLIAGACQRDDAQHSGLSATLEFSPSTFREGAVGTASLQFKVVNLSDRDVDTKPSSWRIIVDSIPFSIALRKTVILSSGGPQPFGGLGTLHPAQSYEFSRMFDLADYVRKPGTYAVWWEGDGFHSPWVKVKIEPKQ